MRAVKRVWGSSLIRVSALSVSREATLREMKLEAPVQNEHWFIPAKRAVLAVTAHEPSGVWSVT